jgi:hypothetical protein
LTKLQIFLAELSLQYDLKLGKNSINKDLIDWSKSGKTVTDYFFYPGSKYKYKLDGDEMFHINKGVFGIRADAINKLSIKNCVIKNIENIGRLGNTELNGEYLLSHDQQKIPGYHGSDASGINLSCCDNVKINTLKIKEVKSANGEARGIRIINDCTKISLKHLRIDTIYAGTKFKGKYLGEDYHGASVEYSYKYPNLLPSSVGIKECDPCKELRIYTDDIKVSNLEAPGSVVPIWLQ